MSLVYWLSKFSEEAILFELFLIGVVGVSYFGYLLTKKRRYGAAKNNIPDNVVKAFLIELLSSTEGFKKQLFGEEFKHGGLNITAQPGATLSPMMANIMAAAGMAAPVAGATASDSTAMAATGAAPEVAALKTQVAQVVAKNEELTKTVTTLTTEKAALEAKAGSAPAATGDAGKQIADLNDKIAKLESKLSEYEVIEDDLANLKKYQQENKQLKAQLDSKGIAPAAAAAPVAEATPPAPPAAEPSPLAAAEAAATDTKAAESFEGLVDKVEESLAIPAGASATDPAVTATAATTAPVADAPAAMDAALKGDAPAAEQKPEKSDADLLNEFERMLSS